MDIEDSLDDDARGVGLEEAHGEEYDAMVEKRKRKRKKKKKRKAFKADARLWNDETRKWAEDIGRDREGCTLTKLLTELNFVFSGQEGRARLKAERLEAKRIYHANVQGNNEKAKTYPDKYARGIELPVIRGNFYRLIEMFDDYIYEQKSRDAAATREKNAMRDELAKMRKRIWVYRRAHAGEYDRDDMEEGEGVHNYLLRKADEQYKYYVSSEEDKLNISDDESDSDDEPEKRVQQQAKRVLANAKKNADDIQDIVAPMVEGDTPLAQLAGAASSSGTPAKRKASGKKSKVPAKKAKATGEEEGGKHAFIGKSILWRYQPEEGDDEYEPTKSKRRQPWLYKPGKIIGIESTGGGNEFEIEFPDEWLNEYVDETAAKVLIKNYEDEQVETSRR